MLNQTRLPESTGVALIGSGFSGLTMAVELKRAGREDFVVLERANDVAGTWRDNTYPGCACDVPSHLYSFGFAPNPEWSSTFSPQQEICAYIRRVAEEQGLMPHIRFGIEVEQADWDDEAREWRLRTSAGELAAKAIASAAGPLSEPAIPDIPGLRDFEGTLFHSATWDHDHDLSGGRVAVIGTGASAIQFVPEIQPAVECLTIFQRTPPWVVPHRDRPITDGERAIYRRLPALQRAVRAGVYAGREALVPGLVHRPQLMHVLEKAARAHLHKHVADPELRAKLTPDYTLGCKRILPSNKWYPAITKPNVDLVTDGIDHVRPDGIVDRNGELHQVDTIVFATGFHVTDIRIAHRLTGAAGTTLDAEWDGSPEAYRGTAVAGFPNLFFLVGPNTGLGHNSIVFMIEAQVAYVMDALDHMDAASATRVEVKADAQRAYNDHIQRKLADTVWNTGGCSSWYIDRNGRNATIWPDFTFRFRSQTRRFDPQAYELTAGTRAAAAPAGLAPA